MILNLIQISISILLIIIIIMQKQGSGLGASFGGETSSFMTKRGLEKKLFISTIVLAVLFLGISLLRLII